MNLVKWYPLLLSYCHQWLTSISFIRYPIHFYNLSYHNLFLFPSCQLNWEGNKIKKTKCWSCHPLEINGTFVLLIYFGLIERDAFVYPSVQTEYLYFYIWKYKYYLIKKKTVSDFLGEILNLSEHLFLWCMGGGRLIMWNQNYYKNW